MDDDDKALQLERVPVAVIGRLERKVDKWRSNGWKMPAVVAGLQHAALEEWNMLQKAQPVGFTPDQLADYVAKGLN